MGSFFRVLKSGFSSFVRNGWLSFASITVMVLALLTLSLFFIINVVLNTGIKTIQDKIDISVYLKDTAKTSMIVDIQKELSNLNEVKSVSYVSKGEALERFKEQNKNNPKILESIEGNEDSLPASLEVKITNPDQLEGISGVLEKEIYRDAVEKISYKENKAVIDKLLRATNFSQRLGIGITIAFSIVSLVIIFNTVRIAIFARMEEIEIMKLVGATPGFIKGPFLIEGALYGIIATVISFLVLTSILYISAPTIVKYFGETGSDFTTFMNQNVLTIIVLQLSVGLSIGIFSSWLAIRKHLKYNQP
jgi:cell division transport system permease protein